MWEYTNGDYRVKILDDGTKIREGDGVPEFPESIDVKITNDCDMACPYCHEGSYAGGLYASTADLGYLLGFWLPEGIEFAFGGGNPLLCVRELRDFMKWHRRIVNVTVNAAHLIDFPLLFEPTAVGVSYNWAYHNDILKFVEKRRNTVIHLVAGVHSMDDFVRCLRQFPRVLVMGYKRIGRGACYYNADVEQNIARWKRDIGHYLGRKVLAFDNLALEQLDIKRYYTDEEWDKMYMGEEGEFSMYLDLVEMEFARSSTSLERRPVGRLTVPEMFAQVREEAGFKAWSPSAT